MCAHLCSCIVTNKNNCCFFCFVTSLFHCFFCFALSLFDYFVFCHFAVSLHRYFCYFALSLLRYFTTLLLLYSQIFYDIVCLSYSLSECSEATQTCLQEEVSFQVRSPELDSSETVLVTIV